MMNRETTQSEDGNSGKFLRIFSLLFGVAAIFSAAFFFLALSHAEDRTGTSREPVVVSFGKDADAFSLAGDLDRLGVIENRVSFLYVLWKDGSWKSLQAGNYLLNGDMTIGEIIRKIVRGETVEKGIKVTFPEGWTAEEMADRLTESGLPGEEFLLLVRTPLPEWRSEYPFLASIPEQASLEGLLFPDTYFFSSTGGAGSIVKKMLDGFSAKAEPVLETASKLSWYETLTLASIVEAEVATADDRRLVADIFLRRLEAGMPLQSDATVRYVLGEKKVKYSLDDIAADSPYNTYRYKGLPPGPIGNPGLLSIRSVISPTKNPYWYFLNNAETGESVFSETFEEHVSNKSKHGL